jgi:hypothetical protein
MFLCMLDRSSDDQARSKLVRFRSNCTKNITLKLVHLLVLLCELYEMNIQTHTQRLLSPYSLVVCFVYNDMTNNDCFTERNKTVGFC